MNFLKSVKIQKVVNIISDSISFLLALLTLSQFFDAMSVFYMQLGFIINTIFQIFLQFFKKTKIQINKNTAFPAYTALCIYIIKLVLSAAIICLVLFSNLTNIEYIPLSGSAVAIIYMVAVFIIIFLEMFSIFVRITEWDNNRIKKPKNIGK